MSTTPDGIPTPAATTQIIPPAPPATRQPGRLRSFLGYLFLPRGKPGELVIVGHSNLFYWWPVWLAGFLITGMTYFQNVHMAFVPEGSSFVHIKKAVVEDASGKETPREDVQAILAPKGAEFPKTKIVGGEPAYSTPFIHPSRGLGLLFMVVLLLVIVITNVPLRGLWSVIIIMLILLGAIILAQAGWWDVIVSHFRVLAIHINMAGYLFFSTVLFVLWLVNFVFFDRQIYIIFSPGQMRVRSQIGGGDTAYETTGMVFHKQRSDLFRHWILGFGSGDLVVRPGQTKEPIEMHNVMNVGRRVREIERLLQEREVVAAAPAPR